MTYIKGVQSSAVRAASFPNGLAWVNWGLVGFLSAVFTHFLKDAVQLTVHLDKTRMEPNGSVSAYGVGQIMAPSLKAEKRADRNGEKPKYGHSQIRPFRLLFVHENLGEFGGAEANLYLTATELQKRGHRVGLVYERGTGKNEQGWREIFGPGFELPASEKHSAIDAAVAQFNPDLLYLHKLSDLKVLEDLLRREIPAVRMVHDHSLTCLRSYKYNYFTR